MAATEELANQLAECAERQDFEAAFRLVRENQAALGKSLSAEGVRDALKKTTKDRLLLSFLDGAGFGALPLDKAVVALEKLLGFTVGSLVLSPAWGLGVVKRLDYFYRRITVDFRIRKGHQFSYSAAVETLESAPESHVLVLRHADPDAFEAMLKDRPGDFVVAVLKSYGDMTVTKLEDVCAANGFVKPANWKAFWDRARADLRKNGLADIPARRADPIRLKAADEDYGDGWFTAFSHETDPKLILARVREYVAHGRFKDADEGARSKIGERLSFAVTASRKVDDALYARLACMVADLGFAQPPAEEMRAYLWDHRRFVRAAAELPSREVGAMIAFLADSEDARKRLYAAIPDMCFTAVAEVVARFGKDSGCREAVGAFMRLPKAPATLTTLIAGKYEQFREWTELPSLVTVLTHAIALGEGRQNGETLKMQNMVRRLFSDRKWVEKIFSWLTESERALVFERFQASIAWDPSTHSTIVVRMTHIDPSLASHFVKAEKKRDYARVTSYRSFAQKKADYLNLINVRMPANIKRIEFAKSYGDLSENSEYQYAKDEQRALMQEQTLMQADLEAVKPTDFAGVGTEEVVPGVTVVIDAPDGERTYHVLGEWDNDFELGIISFKAKLAQNMLAKKVGDKFEMPGTEGSVEFGTVKEIRPLPAEIVEWMKLPAGMQI
jgi:transcription elongation factor GreA